MPEMCVFCRKELAELLCDFPTEVVTSSIDFKTTRTTCDRPICEKCATRVAEDTHFCPRCLSNLQQTLEQRKIEKALAHRPKKK